MTEPVLNGTFPLPKSFKSRRDARTWEQALDGLLELADDPQVGLAAREALRILESGQGDPRLLLLIIEAAMEGYFDPVSAQEYDRQRYAQKKAP